MEYSQALEKPVNDQAFELLKEVGPLTELSPVQLEKQGNELLENRPLTEL